MKCWAALLADLYVPELVLGHLLTGSNFDDTQDRTTGGAYGYGAKLTNIFSQAFEVETAHARSGKRYKQVPLLAPLPPPHGSTAPIRRAMA